MFHPDRIILNQVAQKLTMIPRKSMLGKGIIGITLFIRKSSSTDQNHQSKSPTHAKATSLLLLFYLLSSIPTLLLQHYPPRFPNNEVWRRCVVIHPAVKMPTNSISVTRE